MRMIQPKSSGLVLLVLLCARAVLASDEALPCLYTARATIENPKPEFGSHGDCATLRDDADLVIRPDRLGELDFLEGVATVLVTDRWFYVGRDGRSVPVIRFDNGADPFRQGLARTSHGGKIGFIDKTLRVVIPARYDFAWPFEDGRALVCVGCTRSRPDSNGHTAVIGGRWGYIGTKGQPVVPIGLTRDEALALAADDR